MRWQREGWDVTPQVSPRRAWAALLVLALAAFAFVTAEVLPIGLLTVIAPDLHRSLSQVGLLVSGYAVVVVVASVPLTRLTHRVPRRGLLGITLILFAASDAMAALASTYAVMAGARVVTALTQALFWSVVSPVRCIPRLRTSTLPRRIDFTYASRRVDGALTGGNCTAPGWLSSG